jgi:hypothetical protein
MAIAPPPMKSSVARTAITFDAGGQSGFTPQNSTVPAASQIAMSGVARASMRDSLPYPWMSCGTPRRRNHASTSVRVASDVVELTVGGLSPSAPSRVNR